MKKEKQRKTRGISLSIFLILLVILVGCRNNTGGIKPVLEGVFTQFTADGKVGEILSGAKKLDISKAGEGAKEGLLLEIAYQLNAGEASQMEISYGEYKVAAEDIAYPTAGSGIYKQAIPWNRIKDNGEYEYIDIEAKVFENTHKGTVPLTLKKHFPLVLSKQQQLAKVNEVYEAGNRTGEDSLTVDGMTYALDFYLEHNGYQLGGMLNTHLNPVPDVTGLEKYKSQQTGYYLIPKENSDKDVDIILFVGQLYEMDSSTQEEIEQVKGDFKMALNTFTEALSQMNDYILTLESASENGGKISFDNSSWTASATQVVIEGNNVSIYAKAETTHTFTGWYEGETQLSTDNPTTLTINEERTITARFEEKPNVPPTVEKVSGVSGMTNDDSATFIWRGTDTDGSVDHYACKKDDGDWLITEETQHNWTGYSEGGHSFSVKAIDNEGAESSVITWIFEYKPEYTISLDADPERGGDISLDNETWTETASKTVTKGTNVVMYAKAETGYNFDGWFEGNTFLSKSNPYTVTVNTNRNIRARYIERGVNVINIQVNPEEKGDISLDNETWSDRESKMVTKETELQLYAKAAEKCRFEGWYENGSKISENNPHTIILTDDRTIEARFMDVNTLTIQATPAEEGDVSFNNIAWKDTDEQTVFRGTTLKIYAQAALGYVFEGWYEGDVEISEENPLSVTVDTDRRIEARFIEVGTRLVTLKTNPEEGGDISFDNESWKDRESQAVTKGNNTFYARASFGWLFDGWYENGVKVSNEESYTVLVDTDRTLEARYIRGAGITITANPTEGGDVAFDNASWKDEDCQTVTKGTEVDVYAQTTFGWLFDGWYEGEEKVSEETHYTFELTDDRRIEARYTRGAGVIISASPSEKGDISLDNEAWKDRESHTVEKGESVSLYARVALDICSFDGWYENNIKVSEENPYSPTLTEDRTLEARFRYKSGAILWSENYGGTQMDDFYNLVELSDGSFVFIGYSYSDVPGNNGNKDAWVVKTDSDGTLLWSKNYGGPSNDSFESVIELKDGSLVFAGWSWDAGDDVPGNMGDDDAWAVRTDAAGNILWTKNYGGSRSDEFAVVMEQRDGNLIFVGCSSSNDHDVSGNNGDHDGWVMKTDVDGNLLWSRSYGGSDDDYFRGGIEQRDGSFLFTGNTKSDDKDVPGNNGVSDGWVVKTDAAGGLLWSRSYGGSDDDCFRGGIEQRNGNLLFTGNTKSDDKDVPGNNGNSDGWVMKTDAAGTILWSRNYGGTENDYLRAEIEQGDGSLIFVGSSLSNEGDVSDNNGDRDGWVMKTNTAGTILWTKLFGGSDWDAFEAVTQQSDGTLVLAGYADSGDGDVPDNKGNYDGWTVKLAEIY